MTAFMFRIAAALAASTLAAAAADLPSKSAEPEFEPPPPIPVFSWTGAYAGVHGGVEFGRDAARLIPAVDGGGAAATAPGGILGGAHGGFNYAVPNLVGTHDLVVGAEADVDGAAFGAGTAAYGALLRTGSDVKGSVRGRLGVALSRVLVYATGGLTAADFSTATRPVVPPGPDVHATRAQVGYTLGAGVEYAFMNKYALRAEYRLSSYAPFTTPLDPAAAAAPAVSHRETDNRLQAGISYRFEPASTPDLPAR